MRPVAADEQESPAAAFAWPAAKAVAKLAGSSANELYRQLMSDAPGGS